MEGCGLRHDSNMKLEKTGTLWEGGGRSREDQIHSNKSMGMANMPVLLCAHVVRI